jgi:hypothetical protein
MKDKLMLMQGIIYNGLKGNLIMWLRLCGSLMQILMGHDSQPNNFSTKHKISEGQKMNLDTIQRIIWSPIKHDYVEDSITNDQ